MPIDTSMYNNARGYDIGRAVEGFGQGVGIATNLAALRDRQAAQQREQQIGAELANPDNYAADEAALQQAGIDPRDAAARGAFDSNRTGSLADLNAGAKRRIASIDPKWAMSLEQLASGLKRDQAEIQSYADQSKARKLDNIIKQSEWYKGEWKDMWDAYLNAGGQSGDPDKEAAAVAVGNSYYQSIKSQARQVASLFGMQAPDVFSPEEFDPAEMPNFNDQIAAAKRKFAVLTAPKMEPTTVYGTDDEIGAKLNKLGPGAMSYKQSEYKPEARQGDKPYTEEGQINADLRAGAINEQEAQQARTRLNATKGGGAVTDLGKLKQDLDGKYITQEQYDQAVGEKLKDPNGLKPLELAKLTKDYGDSYYKESQDFLAVQESFANIASLAEGDPSAVDQIGLVFSVMKMFDPGSTVREGEYATAQNAAGVPEMIRNYWNKMKDGRFLGETQIKEIVGTAGTLYESKLSAQKQRAANMRGIAERNGLPVEDILARAAQRNIKKPMVQVKKQVSATPEAKPAPKIEKGKPVDFSGYTQAQLLDVDISTLDGDALRKYNAALDAANLGQ